MQTEPQTMADVLAGWHDFYFMLGGASATLVGLLFVSLSLRLNRVRDATRFDLRAFVSQTFGNFIYVLLVSAMMLIPMGSNVGLGVPLLIIGSIGLLDTLRQFHAVRRSGQRAWGARTMRLIALPVLAFVGLDVIAVSVLDGQTDGLYWLVGVVLVLVTTAAGNAYRLLLDVPEG